MTKKKNLDSYNTFKSRIILLKKEKQEKEEKKAPSFSEPAAVCIFAL